MAFMTEADVQAALDDQRMPILRTMTYNSLAGRVLTPTRMAARTKTMPYLVDNGTLVKWVHGNFGDSSRRKPVSGVAADAQQLVAQELAGIKAVLDETMQDFDTPRALAAHLSQMLSDQGRRAADALMLGPATGHAPFGGTPTGWSQPLIDQANAVALPATMYPGFDNAALTAIQFVNALPGRKADRILVSSDVLANIYAQVTGDVSISRFVPSGNTLNQLAPLGTFMGIPVYVDYENVLGTTGTVVALDHRYFVMGIRMDPEFRISREAVLTDENNIVGNMYQEDGWALRYAWRLAYLSVVDGNTSTVPAAKVEIEPETP